MPPDPINNCFPLKTHQNPLASNLNMLYWRVNNILSIALSNTIYLWDTYQSTKDELLTVEDDVGPITSVKWAPDGRHIGVGLTNSVVQLWDSASNRQVE